jgi:hypothetical protein
LFYVASKRGRCEKKRVAAVEKNPVSSPNSEFVAGAEKIAYEKKLAIFPLRFFLGFCCWQIFFCIEKPMGEK